MILLTRLGGHGIAVNPDLIERAEATPDTVLTMIDGHKIIVAERLDEVIDRVHEWRATLAARALGLYRLDAPAASEWGGQFDADHATLFDPADPNPFDGSTVGRDRPGPRRHTPGRAGHQWDGSGVVHGGSVDPTRAAATDLTDAQAALARVLHLPRRGE